MDTFTYKNTNGTVVTRSERDEKLEKDDEWKMIREIKNTKMTTDDIRKK